MKLHLRDLFWLILVVALGCAWWVDRWQLNWAREADREILLRKIVDLNMQNRELVLKVER